MSQSQSALQFQLLHWHFYSRRTSKVRQL